MWMCGNGDRCFFRKDLCKRTVNRLIVVQVYPE